MELELFLLALFFVVLLPRVLTPSSFVGADEPAWAYRSLHFLQGLLEGDLAQTFQTGHPGVLTMWAGAIGATVHQLERGEPLKAAVANLPVLAGGEFDPYDLILLRRVSPMLPAACIATATFDTLLLLMIFALLWRSFDRGTALLALGLLAFVIFKLVVVVFTSVQGSLMVVSGICAILMKIEPLRSKLQTSMSSNIHLLALLIVVPAVIGFALQYTAVVKKARKKRKASENA